MTEVLEFFVLQATLLAVVLVLHTYIGLHIIRRTLIFSDLVLDQLAAFGGLTGIALGIPYGTAASYLISLLAVVGGAGLLAVIRPRRAAVPREAVIGILYALALVATLLAGDRLARGADQISRTLTGSMAWVSWPLVAVTLGVYIGLTVFHVVFRRRIIALAEEERGTAGDTLWEFLFFTTQGVITVLIVPIAGVLLAYAFLMMPAATAALFRRDWGGATLLGWGAGFSACLAGLAVSYFLDLPYAPTLVLALGALFGGAALIRAARRGRG